MPTSREITGVGGVGQESTAVGQPQFYYAM